MIRLRAITWAMGIWATAFSTLLAGLPHLQCRCPDGRIKPFCLSFVIPSTCCGRSCCAGPTDSQAERSSQESTKKPCCCCQALRPAPNNPAEQIGPQGCQKTLAKAHIAARSDIVRYSAHDFVSPLLDYLVSEPFATAEPESRRFTASFPWSLPSPDLVIALGRLLI